MCIRMLSAIWKVSYFHILYFIQVTKVSKVTKLFCLFNRSNVTKRNDMSKNFEYNSSWKKDPIFN